MTSGLESNLYGSSVQIWCVLRDRHYNHSTLVREIDPQNLTLGKLFTAKAPRRGDAKEDLDLLLVLQVPDLFGSRPNHYLPGKLSLASLRLGVLALTGLRPKF
jgi:hypothetical protein